MNSASSFSPPSSSDSSATLATSSALLLCACFAGDNGEGEDDGFGAGEEGDDEGEGKGGQSGRIFVKDRPAVGLDPGRLDLLDDPLEGP